MKKKDNKLIVFKNKDKEGWYEKWDDKRDLLNFPHPWRAIISANPGSGKTNMIKNIILKTKPFFKKIYLCHFDNETKEYDDLDCLKLDDIPDSRSALFKSKQKNLLIIDDYDFGSLNRFQLSDLRSLFKYGSTHKGLSIVVATQDFFALPSIIRRLSNIYFVWKGSCDIDSLYMIGRRIGFKKAEFAELLDLCKCKFDNICIDLTVDTPAPIRLNGYTLVRGVQKELIENKPFDPKELSEILKNQEPNE